MKCERCERSFEESEFVTHGGATVCEDCLMDLLSPAKACDPWAVKLAKGAAATTSEAAEALKGLEKALYEAVKSQHRVPKSAVPELLGVRPTDVERAFAVLRHMELLRADKGADGVVSYVLFGAE